MRKSNLKSSRIDLAAIAIVNLALPEAGENVNETGSMACSDAFASLALSSVLILASISSLIAFPSCFFY